MRYMPLAIYKHIKLKKNLKQMDEEIGTNGKLESDDSIEE